MVFITDIKYENLRKEIDDLKNQKRISYDCAVKTLKSLKEIKMPKNIEAYFRLLDLIDKKLKQEFIKRGNYGGIPNG